MKNNSFIVVLALLVLCCTTSLARATLITIGTASYGGADYKMIWDNDNNGNSVVWLDYTHAGADWATQHAWAENLDSFLTYDIDPQYIVTWDAAAWHLSDWLSGPAWGYNVTGTELGHLYYEELGNIGYVDEFDNVNLDYGLQNTGPFDHLMNTLYWGEYSRVFHLRDGYLDGDPAWVPYQAIALRGGLVSVITPVPEPATALLFVFGAIGFAGISQRTKLKHLEVFLGNGKKSC